MKKLSTALLSLLLCLALVLSFAACDTGDGPDVDPPAATTAPDVDATEEPTTEAPTDPVEPTVSDTEPLPAETPADTGEDESREPDEDYDPETYVVIRTAEDLMNFNKAVNEDMEEFYDMTVVFLNDIDMSGYTWTPLDGSAFDYTVFDGKGHTISNLQFADHDVEPGTPAEQIGTGFVGIAMGSLTFRDITFDTCKVTAHERAVGCLIGLNFAQGGYTDFENVTVKNFTADGWMDYKNTNRDDGGFPISFRVSAFIGHNLSGGLEFTNCRAENITLSGFHNLSAFVGYDATRAVDAYCFEGCHVENADMTFSYCLSDSYTIDQPRKFVSVFFNQANWAESIEACVLNGNTFENVTFHDFTDEGSAYTPSEFLSWSYEEAYPNG